MLKKKGSSSNHPFLEGRAIKLRGLWYVLNEVRQVEEFMETFEEDATFNQACMLKSLFLRIQESRSRRYKSYGLLYRSLS